MKKSQNGFFLNSRDVTQVPRGTPQSLLSRWPMATTSFRDRLEMIYGNADVQYVLRRAHGSRTYRELIRRYSNDTML